jgi:hypothetical protein
VLVIGEAFCQWEDSKRRIDLLAIDEGANVVEIELKRTEDGGHMELQAVRYAAMVSAITFDKSGHLPSVARRACRGGRRGLARTFGTESLVEARRRQGVAEARARPVKVIPSTGFK